VSRRAAITVHAHRGPSPHKDVRLSLLQDDGTEGDVFHFFGGAGLPKPGKIARWRAIEAPHEGEMTPEVSEPAEMVPHESGGQAFYLHTPSGRYAISETGDVCYVKNLEKPAEKTADVFDAIQGNPMLETFAVNRARSMGFIPPNYMAPGYVAGADQEPTLLQRAESALGTAAKTVALGALGGFGAAAGWSIGNRLMGRHDHKRASTAPEEDPADSPQPAGEDPAMYRPADPNIHRPADAAATPTHVMTEGRFGHLPSDPL
jgi:hypothetical protein